jgi:hypothetical protein
VRTKSPGFPAASSAMLAMTSVASPLLVMVTGVVPLVVPWRWFVNVMLVGASVAVGAACPVPVRDMD